MKNIYFIILILFCVLTQAQNIGINSTGSTPNASAGLDIDFNNKGLLIPRVGLTSTTDVATIALPAISLLVYNNNASITGTGADGVGFYYWNGSLWIKIANQQDNAWLTTGNAGTDTAINFIGTTDDMPIRFKINNQYAGQLGYASNYFIGGNAGRHTTNTSSFYGIGNVGFGYNALADNYDGFLNIAIGNNPLKNNISGHNNIALGLSSLYHNTNGHDNIAIGQFSLDSNTTGDYNIAIGFNSLYNNKTGEYNVAYGYRSLFSNTTGNRNTAYGVSSLYNNSTGYYNTAIGFQNLYNNTIGKYNVATGYKSLYNNIAGDYNVAQGTYAGYSNLGSNSVFLGAYAGYNSTTSNKLYIENSDVDSNAALIYGEFDNNILRTNSEFQIHNPAIDGYAFPETDGTNGQVLETDGNGQLSWVDGNNEKLDTMVWLLKGNAGTDTAKHFIGTTDDMPIRFKIDNQWAGQWDKNLGNYFIGDSVGTKTISTNAVNGRHNIAIGNKSLVNNNNGQQNIALGNNVLYANNNGIHNIALGYNVLLKNINGSNNIAMGASALKNIEAGYYNIALGYGAMTSASGGSDNIAIGVQTLYSNTLGDLNIAIGENVLVSNTTGDNNVGLGSFSLSNNSTGNNNTAVGNVALDGNTKGNGNSAFGSATLRNIKNGNYNTAIGNGALHFSENSNNNTAVGTYALFLNKIGNYNIAIGDSAGFNNLGSNSVFIGSKAGTFSTTSNKLYIENSDADSTQALIYGEFDNDRLRINNRLGINTTPTYALDIVNDDFTRSIDIDHNTNLTSTNYGIYIDIDKPANSTGGTLYGLYSNAYKASTANNSFSVYGIATGASNAYSGANLSHSYGISSSAYKYAGTSGSSYGGYFYAYNEAGTNAYGIYARTAGSPTTEYAGYFSGDVYSTGAYLPSDDKLKTLGDNNNYNALNKLLALNVHQYEYKNQNYKYMKLPKGKQTGFIAQEMETLFPELVKTTVQPAQYEATEPKEGVEPKLLQEEIKFKAVNYVGLIPHTVKAIQEQQNQLEALKTENESLKQEIENIKTMLNSLTNK
ncbi:MAG: tail fiber domain-containing protein [Chitinophagales bacterium]|nr:tail fiber domain-containing protein [Chitinophagales bacterium]